MFSGRVASPKNVRFNLGISLRWGEGVSKQFTSFWVPQKCQLRPVLEDTKVKGAFLGGKIPKCEVVSGKF